MKFDFSKEPGRAIYNRDLVTTETPLLSVVTPYYNAKKYFQFLYPCVLNQTFPWFEWIIVDDGSNEKGELNFLSQIEDSDPRIKVVHKPNGGISSARNKGIQNSTTDIIITLDADELIEPTYFEVLYWALYFNADAAWAYTDSVGFQNQEYVWKYPFNSEKLKTYNFLVESAAIRKKDLIEVGCYDEVEKHYFEDWRLWLKMLSNGKKPVHVTSLEFWYRRTDTGVLNIITTDDNRKKRADFLISEVASTVDTKITAKTFKGYLPREYFVCPQKSIFDKPYRVQKEKTEILFFIPWMVVGGADQFNLDFVRLLDKEKYNITIVATENSENEWKQKFREYTPYIYTLPDFLDVKNYAEFISYIIQTRKIDICLISNSYYGYYILPWIKSQYPEVAVIDYVHMEEMYWRNGGYARTSMAMSDLIEKTYVCNDSTRKAFLSLFGRKENEVETIYIGVDQEKFNPEKVMKGTIRSKYHIPDNGKVVIFPCRLCGQKRPYLMIDIAKSAVEKNENIYFIVVGDGEELTGMQMRVKEYGLDEHVFFAGLQDDVRPFYRDADLTLICSLREGLSLTAYESCAMRTPVVTVDVGGQCELIDNTVGELIPLMQREQDIDKREYSKEEILKYTNAILNILKDSNCEKYLQMCLNCRKKIEDKFGLDTMIKNMELAIEECFSSKRIEMRKRYSDAISLLPSLATDSLSMYIVYEGMVQENSRVWNERCYFQDELNQSYKTIQGLEQSLKNTEDQLNIVKTRYNIICNSSSLKLGQAISFIPRKLKGGFNCIKDHGIVYTLKYALSKL